MPFQTTSASGETCPQSGANKCNPTPLQYDHKPDMPAVSPPTRDSTSHSVVQTRHQESMEKQGKAQNDQSSKEIGASMDMVEAFVGGWLDWLSKGSLPETSTFPPNIKAAMDSQSQIGWGQVIHGRISKEWGTLRSMETHGIPLGTKSAPPSSLWVLDTLDALWSKWFDLSKERNNFIHGKTKQEQMNKRRLAVEQKITELHNRKSDCLPLDRSLLKGTAASFIKNKSLTTLTNCLTVWQPMCWELDDVTQQKTSGFTIPR